MKAIYETPRSEVIELMSEQAFFSASNELEEDYNTPHWEFEYDF